MQELVVAIEEQTAVRHDNLHWLTSVGDMVCAASATSKALEPAENEDQEWVVPTSHSCTLPDHPGMRQMRIGRVSVRTKNSAMTVDAIPG
jgi:hypothetical protein